MMEKLTDEQLWEDDEEGEKIELSAEDRVILVAKAAQLFKWLPEDEIEWLDDMVEEIPKYTRKWYSEENVDDETHEALEINIFGITYRDLINRGLMMFHLEDGRWKWRGRPENWEDYPYPNPYDYVTVFMSINNWNLEECMRRMKLFAESNRKTLVEESLEYIMMVYWLDHYRRSKGKYNDGKTEPIRLTLDSAMSMKRWYTNLFPDKYQHLSIKEFVKEKNIIICKDGKNIRFPEPTK